MARTVEPEHTPAPHHIFADTAELDAKTLIQFKDAISEPFVTRAALMPDAHLGYSLPIGSVVETKSVVVPSWVGYDIGCGVSAYPVAMDRSILFEDTEEIHAKIRRDIPVGNAKHQTRQSMPTNLLYRKSTLLLQKVIEDRGAEYQIGTLGGGNHFIEVAVSDRDEYVWVVVHSGSRGLGHGVATEYMKLAAGSDKPLEGPYGFHAGEDAQVCSNYLADSSFCETYAFYNRQRIADAVVNVLSSVCPNGAKKVVGFDYVQSINRQHNHVEFIQDTGRFIHRKGATHAESGMLGVIPGNMRDGSYIVRGLGNRLSLCSSSHGAGRAMSRSEARRKLDEAAFVGEMQKSGIVANCIGKVDEAPNAYKSITRVMAQQWDLVKTEAHLRPVINVKG